MYNFKIANTLVPDLEKWLKNEQSVNNNNII